MVFALLSRFQLLTLSRLWAQLKHETADAEDGLVIMSNCLSGDDLAMQEFYSCSDIASGGVSLSIIIPAYNEEQNIHEAVNSIITGVSSCNVNDFEVIVIDDGSVDSTADILKQLASQNDRIRAVFHVANQGKGAALISGFSQARMEWILFTDADLQIDMMALPEFLARSGEYDLLIGYRHARVDTLSRLVVSKLYNLLIGMLFGIRLKDAHCPFKLIRRPVVDSLQLASRGFFIDTELICLAMAHGCRIGELPVKSSRRQCGVSSVRFRHIFEISKELLLFLRRSQKRSGCCE